ncbi:MAG: hypothetical protein WCB02_33940 [Bradyrhizobium sp.]
MSRVRVRLSLETFKEVRAKVGARVPVGVRISQGKVNDYHHKWAGAERDAEIIFGSLADDGADFVHVTEFRGMEARFRRGRSVLDAPRQALRPKGDDFRQWRPAQCRAGGGCAGRRRR